MAIDKVKALGFDVFGTVVDWRASVAREVRGLCAPKGIEVDWEAFATAWRARYQPSMAKVRSGERPFVILDVLHRENLEGVLEAFGISGLTEPEKDHLNRAWHRLDPWPDSPPGLARLRKRYPLATLSNGNVALMVGLARHGNLPFDAILGAEVARGYKPDPQVYQTTARMLGLEPHELMLVAAHNNDLVAARAAGLRTAFVTRPTEHGPGQTIDLVAEHDFDVVAEDMLDLASRLGC
ncbi:MAG: haloacid dehalogenase type II [Ectothiorhodospiraceae bacterium]|nr:haloacid dehalogenase type II [Chromatiales bacterium]MCP5154533.1 haloacid dehalogenase type II [Ectothiorhodospiraceae bacterium]